jgi:hypothetical protein
MMTADLLSRARAGDGEAFRELTGPHRRERGTSHFARATIPADEQRAGEHEARCGQLRESMTHSLSETFPDGHDAADVADQIVRVVNLPARQRPFRTHIDPSRDRSEVVSAVSDRIRAEFHRRTGSPSCCPTRPPCNATPETEERN